MNFSYPYMNMFPARAASSLGAAAGRGGFLSSLFRGGINWSSILTNTQKTLGIVNQAIPVIKQAGPIVNNAKTMFKVMNEFKKTDLSTQNNQNNNDTLNNNDLNNTNNINNTENNRNSINETNNINNENEKTAPYSYSTGGPTFYI